LTIEKPVVIKSAKDTAMQRDQATQRAEKKQKIESWPNMDDWNFDEGFGSDG